MDDRKQIKVRIHGASWGVFDDDQPTPESVHDRKIDAVAAAHELADGRDAEIVVYRLDGRPQE